MFGFVLGTLCLFGLVKVLRHRGAPAFAFGGPCGGFGRGFYRGGPRHHDFGDGSFFGHGYGDPGGYGWQRGEGGRDWDGRGDGSSRRGFGGRFGGGRFFLRGLFERLDTTPGQEKVFTEALDELRRVGSGIKDEVRSARSELATALRGESFDEVLLGGATARIETSVESLRKAGIDAFAKIHGALDPRQRGILADYLERGPRGFGPFR